MEASRTTTRTVATTALVLSGALLVAPQRAAAQHHHHHHATAPHDEPAPTPATATATPAPTPATPAPATPAPAEPAHVTPAARHRDHAPPPPPPPPPPPTHAHAEPEPSHGIPWRLQPGRHDSSLEVEVHGSLTLGFVGWPWNGFAVGPGVRLGVPLMRNGPIASINNDWRISFGVDTYFWLQPEVYVAFAAPVALQWNFFLTPYWSLFIEVGGQVDVYPTQGISCYDHPQYYCDVFTFHPLGGAGARIHLGGDGRFPTFTFRFEYPTGLTFGASF